MPYATIYSQSTLTIENVVSRATVLRACGLARVGGGPQTRPVFSYSLFHTGENRYPGIPKELYL
jgi:hypothetical protein